ATHSQDHRAWVDTRRIVSPQPSQRQFSICLGHIPSVASAIMSKKSSKNKGKATPPSAGTSKCKSKAALPFVSPPSSPPQTNPGAAPLPRHREGTRPSEAGLYPAPRVSRTGGKHRTS
ncbi:hypothetical protein A4X09_0g4371, partial [Tilletia walkeri]